MKYLGMLLLAISGWASAATITATSCAQPAVEAAIASAVNGDTVVVPAGACTWGTFQVISKQIKLTGAPAGGTVITGSGSGNILQFTIGTQFRTELANLRFMPGTATGNYVVFYGQGLAPYMHDMYFNLPNFQLQHAVGWYVSNGVISKVTFESTQNLGGACGTQIGSDSGSIVVKPAVPIPWGAASTMGMAGDPTGEKNVYIEDSIFSNVGQAPDLDDNARAVIRNSQYIGSAGLTHGTTSTYGGRHVEIYDNAMTLPNPWRNFNRYFWFRAGTGVITGNTMDAMSGSCYGNKPSFQFSVENVKRGGANEHGCCTGYMCYHQPGSGSDGTGGHSNLSAGQIPPDPNQISEPIWIWGNTGPGADPSRFTLNEGQPDQCGGTFSTGDFFKLGRDWFMNAGAKPGWARYTYPHPVTQGGPPPPPTQLPAPTNFVLAPSATAPLLSVDVAAGTTSCLFYVDSRQPIVVQATGTSCKMDLTPLGLTQASHSVAADARGAGFTPSVKSKPFVMFYGKSGNMRWYGGVDVVCDTTKCVTAQ